MQTYHHRRQRSASNVASLMACALVCVGCDIGFSEAAQACDPLQDEGCPVGQLCSGLAVPACVAAGQGTHGQTCQGDGDCANKHLCVTTAQGGQCRRRCDVKNADACAEPSAAGQTATASSICLRASPSGAFDLGYCTLAGCDPSDNKGCADGELCVGGLEPACKPTGQEVTVTDAEGQETKFRLGTQEAGQTCLGAGHCRQGHVCALTSTSGGAKERRCLQACSVDAADTACGVPFTCKALTFKPSDSNSSRALPGGQGYCVRSHCHPLTHEACPTGKKCIGSATPYCTDPGNVAYKGACTKLADCDMGTTCVSGGGQTLCVLKCDTSGSLPDHQCPDDMKCYTLPDIDGKPKPDHLGFCGPKG